jgi:alpha-beta hydrolase superfamily lysophospholipase
MADPRARGTAPNRWGRFLLGTLVAVAAAWVALGLVPSGVRATPPHPAAGYEDALRRIARFGTSDPESLVSLDCRTRVLTHGHKTHRAVVLLHGFTNCPAQFDSLGAGFAKIGYNVLIPRLPRHGYANRMTDALAGLTAEELVAAGQEALDIAHGLGDRVSVVGLSSSGVLAGWLAQNRPDVDRAMLIAPSFAPRGIPLPVARRLANLLTIAPNFFVWWDPRRKDAFEGPRYAYPRFPSRTLGQVYKLGQITIDEAGRRKPLATDVVILTTAADEGVNNAATGTLERRWRQHGTLVYAAQFAESLGVHHDMIDPNQPYQEVERSYPVILRLMTPRDAAPQTARRSAAGRPGPLPGSAR